jgi:hypothetical protein
MPTFYLLGIYTDILLLYFSSSISLRFARGVVHVNVTTALYYQSLYYN